jgi:geranylgeranyl reductase family protein
MPESFDAIVVGAGPAGSTSAYFLAREGLSVLLLDRASFPRDKPCGGGVTGRAAALLPFSIDPVVEDVVDRLEIGLSYARRFERRSEKPLIYMTRRARLDAFLVERAREAGATFRDATKVTEVELRADDVLVKTKDWTGAGRVVIGADGTNGVTARALGCEGARLHLVALEADLSYDTVDRERYRGRAVLQLGAVPGGYGWIFPKADHVNVGVGGWETEGPRLRSHLAALVGGYGLGGSLENVRGYRLPLRAAGDGLANGRGLVVGDAAGLVDPLTGDGMYEAFLSARLAASAVADFLDGRASELTPYADATLRALGPLCIASWGGKRAFDRFPRLTYSVARTRRAWRVIADLLQEDGSAGVDGHPLPLFLTALLAATGGGVGRPYQDELRRVRAAALVDA